MSNQTRLIISIVILLLAALVLVLPTGVGAVLEHNLWSMAAAEAAFGNGQVPPLRPNPHPHAYQWLARLALKENDTVAATAWLSRSGDVQDPFTKDALAWTYFQEGAHLRAINLWQEIGYSDRLIDIAQAALDDGDFELSLLARRAAYEIDPINQTTEFANALRRMEAYFEVEALLFDALHRNPTSDQRATWWRTLGELYRDQGDWIKAKDAFHNALLIDPKDSTSWVRLGWLVYGQTNDADAAIGYFKEAIRVRSSRSIGYYAIGRVLLREEQPEQALNWFRQASEKEPKNLNNLLVYANLLRDTGQFEFAFFEYEKAVNGWPASWYPYYHVSWAYLLDGQPDLAFQAIEKAIELNPDNIGTHLRAGEIYEAFGEVDLALAAYQAVLAIDPEYAVALRAVERLTGVE
jgi:tetratricopeptide (TPR) repeat protein